jgi:hypothetical protein
MNVVGLRKSVLHQELSEGADQYEQAESAARAMNSWQHIKQRFQEHSN